MNIEVVSVGELLVEVMREKVGQPLDTPGTFVGPFASGAPAIFADAVAKLGVQSGIIGSVGKDDFGKLILERLNQDGVDITYVSSLKDYTTGVAFVTYFSDGSRKFIYHLPQAASGKISLDQIDKSYLSGVKYLHIMGSSLSINEQCQKVCYKAVEIVKNSGGKISFDPNLRPELLSVEKIRQICQPVLSSCEVILPSEDEAKMLTGNKDSLTACKELLNFGPKIVILKCGARGSVVFTPNEKIEVPSFKVKEVDPTGAGDCFDAGVVVGMLRGWNLKRVAKFANAVGALTVGKKGPMEGTPNLDQVNHLLAGEK
ncbi:sugar kinase [Candidatus Aerophobetes bacterium]|nr:sugar kinase [Candidatus Aerophobetes bacterium]